MNLSWFEIIVTDSSFPVIVSSRTPIHYERLVSYCNGWEFMVKLDRLGGQYLSFSSQISFGMEISSRT